MPKIDKSALALGEPRRVRSEQHRRFVAEYTCIACFVAAYPGRCYGRAYNGQPHSQASHIRFGQRGGMGLKPGDDLVWPLCYMHHREFDTWPDGPRDWIVQRFCLDVAKKLAGMSPDQKVRDAA